jgi:hypothetical protein
MVDGGVAVRVRRDERDAAARAAFFRRATGDAAARFRTVFFARVGPFARFDAGLRLCAAARLIDADRFVRTARFTAAGLFDGRCGTSASCGRAIHGTCQVSD